MPRTPRNAPTSDQEAAVRDYLEYVADPIRMERERSEQAEAIARRAEQTKDVLERLALLRDARQARQGVADKYVEGFVAHAAEYARANGYTADDFRALGVPQSVLARAGLVASRGTAGRRRAATGGRAGRSRTDLAIIRAWAREQGHQVSDRGRIAAATMAAYEAAHRI